jgi:hypothetical protein
MELVTLGDAARALNLPYQTVYAAYARGRVPHQRAGMAILVRVADVAESMKDYSPRKRSNPTMRPNVA